MNPKVSSNSGQWRPEWWRKTDIIFFENREIPFLLVACLLIRNAETFPRFLANAWQGLRPWCDFPPRSLWSHAWLGHATAIVCLWLYRAGPALQQPLSACGFIGRREEVLVKRCICKISVFLICRCFAGAPHAGPPQTKENTEEEQQQNTNFAKVPLEKYIFSPPDFTEQGRP